MEIVNRDISLKSVKNSGIWLELLSLAFVSLALAVAIYSIEQAVWVSPHPSLMLTLLLTVLTTFGLIKTRLPAVVRHGAVLLLGIIVAIWQLSALFAPQPLLKVLEVRPNESTVYFTAFLIFGTWVVGYITTWFMLQRRNAWVTVFIGAVIVMVNLNNLPSNEYYRFFPIYTLSAILLIGQANMAKNLRQLRQYGQSYSSRSALYYASVVVLISALIASSAQFLPEIKINPDSAITTKISWNNSENNSLNIFAAVPGKREILNSDKQSELVFSDPLSQQEEIQFEVNSDKVKYWPTRRYDNYLSWEWTDTGTVNSMLNPGDELPVNGLQQRQEFTYSVTNKLKTNFLLVAGELKMASIPVLLKYLAPKALPGPPEGEAMDIISVVTPQILPSNKTYTVTVWLTQATPIELSRAGTDYGEWVLEHYLQLPESMPGRVKELSQQLTKDAKTPYDKVVEIRNFLQRFRYNITFNSSPTYVDAVDYFIFDKQEGDCTYFASAMAIMLRSVGVPARISSGYRLAEQDKSTGQFIIRARDYHARAEVYFPGYGWIEIEATPGLPGLLSAEGIGLEIAPAIMRGEAAVSQNKSVSSKYGQPFFVDAEGNSFFILGWTEEGGLIYGDKNGVQVYIVSYDAYNDPIFDYEPAGTKVLANTTVSANITVTANTTISANTTVSANKTVSPNTTVSANKTVSANTTVSANKTVSPNTTVSPSTTQPGSTPREMSSETIPPLYPTVLPVMGIVSLIMLITGVVGILLYRRWINRIRRTIDASRVYGRMCALASMSKSGPKPIETPFEYGFRLALVIPAQSQIIDNITSIYAESRFSGHKEMDQTRMAELEQSWFQLYPALVRRILRR